MPGIASGSHVEFSEGKGIVEAMGQACLRAYKLPRCAWDAYEQHHELIKELRGVEGSRDSLPHYTWQ